MIPDAPFRSRAALPTRREIRETLRLALPIVAVQVGLLLMGVVDTLMVGRVSAAALAATALGDIYFLVVAAFGMGTLHVLDPLVAQGVGAGDAPAVRVSFQRGLLLAAALTLPVTLVLLMAGPVFRLLGQPAEVVPLASGYVGASIAGVFPFLAFTVFRQSLQAMGHVRAILWTVLAANLANVLLNWALVYGHAGFPALGAIGSAWASTTCRWLMAVGVLVAARGQLLPLLGPWRREALSPRALAKMLRLGLPVGAMATLEFGAFGVIGILMGLLGAREMAGHQVALKLASLTFMVPLGISAAGAVLVGHAVGRGDAWRARREAGAALVLGVGFMSLSALVFLLLPRPLAHLFTHDVGVAALAASLIPIAGVFQVFDGLQAVSAGLLRGLGDTRFPLLANLLGFWLLGLPLSAWLAFSLRLGPEGLWWGLVAGLAAVGAILLARVRSRLARGVARLEVPG